MARVTVEDCIEKVNNRFELVLMAAKRAKDLEKGAIPSIQRENDKSTIVALREIAGETISLDGLRELAKKTLYDDVDPFVDTKKNDNVDSVESMIDSEDIDIEDVDDDDIDDDTDDADDEDEFTEDDD